MKDGPEIPGTPATQRGIASPCIRICVIHPEARICTGCLRTGDEIAAWARMTDDERQRVMDELPDRKGLLRRRRGGRTGKIARQSGNGSGRG